VSDRVGAAQDLVAPVSPQFIFPCGDVDALSHILRDASSDRTRLQSASGSALAHIQTWSPERNIAATLDAIRIGVTRARGSPNEGDGLSQAIAKKSARHPQNQR
jgi:hypothetical protein